MRFTLLFLLCLVYSSCNTESAERAATEEDPSEASVAAAQQQMERIQEKNDRPVHDKEVLKAMLPEKLLGMDREKSSSNSMGAGGFVIATATATYTDQATDERKITVTISDGMGGNMANMDMVNSFTMDSEEGTKSTKTLQIDGHKAIRTFDSASMSGSLAVVFDQSVVQIEGRQLRNMAELEDAYDELDLDEL
ncbi:hypothetical protein GGR28_003190 [Lewinella aquimaris]|uniref:Uncharacterized protein n=1 Tax=Neolewinella aquimaris TaxID=1835722 RepID=A0A840EI30_9BACT|nr:hypothetical protein [Neolewinella aquimaris]MBB4080556.1 hypothetical protein [Neolewinella aquimaris]